MTLPNESNPEYESANHQEPFDHAAIRSQVARIFSSSEFENSEQLGRFLHFVVEETLAGRSKEIKQYTIAVNAFGRSAHFNPRTDPIVRIQAGRLRRRLAYYYETKGRNDPIRIEIPKGKYVPVFLQKRGHPEDSEFSYEPSTSASASIDARYALPDGPSIAVLPLVYLGNEPEHVYLANGITEEIVIALTRFQEFLVVEILNRDILSQKQLGPRGIGQVYNVRFVLDGTVRLRGRSLRITTKLIDASNGHQLWGQAHDYDLEIASIHQIEDEIVGQIAATIADNFGVIPRTLSKEVSAQHDDSLSDYEAVLRVHHHIRTLTEESLIEALTALEKTIQRDPNHDLAMALLGDLVAETYWLGYADNQSDIERAEELGRRAVSINPNSVPAHFTMAEVYFLRFQKAQFLAEVEKILDLNPNNANYIAVSGLLLVNVGEWERGVTLIHKAMRLNPQYPAWYHLGPCLNYYWLGDYEAALLEAERFNVPDFFWDPLIKAAVFGQLGHQAETVTAVDELQTLVPDFKSRGHSLIQRMVFMDEHVEMLLEGLSKAGLELVR